MFGVCVCVCVCVCVLPQVRAVPNWIDDPLLQKCLAAQVFDAAHWNAVKEAAMSAQSAAGGAGGAQRVGTHAHTHTHTHTRTQPLLTPPFAMLPCLRRDRHKYTSGGGFTYTCVSVHVYVCVCVCHL